MARDIDDHERLAEVEMVLRSHRAEFAFVHGSRAVGTASPESDLDVASWFGREVDPLEVRADLPAGVDLLVLDTAPLELAGRVAQHGVLLFESNPAARVRWQARTRKIYLDEQPRIAQARRDFVRARTRFDVDSRAIALRGFRHPRDRCGVVHDLTLVTRNVADVERTGVSFLNPFSDGG